MAGEVFTQEELADLNDLRRRIANGHEYTEDEVAKAIEIFTLKRTEATAAAPAKKKAAKKTVQKVDLDDLL